MIKFFTAFFFLSLLSLSVLSQTETEPTFIVYKYQHVVGKEIDHCDTSDGGQKCHAHFQLDFTGSSIALDADLIVDRLYRPISYTARGQNSTRSYVDLNVSIAGRQAHVSDTGVERTLTLPDRFYTLQQDVPVLTQEMLMSYWSRKGRPARITLLPAGEVMIRRRGVDPAGPETLTRYTLHGVTWGNETLWLNRSGQIAAVVGSDAEEDRVEMIRPRYRSALKQLVDRAAEDAVDDLVATTESVKPLSSGSFALTHATIIDPSGDGVPLTDMTIFVKNGLIQKIGSNISIPRGLGVLDATGKFVLPGLWDTHAHLEQWEWFPAFLAAGITSVRDVGSEIEFLVPVRRAIDSGRALGPHIIAAGLIDSDPGSLTSEHAETPERARAIVQRYHDLGYEEIKIYQSLKPELIPVVTAEAHRFGMKVTGHIPTGTDALTGVRGGMDMINHISFVTRVMRPAGGTGVNADSPEARDAIRLFLERGTVVEPTLARSEFNLHPRRKTFSGIEPFTSCLPPELAVILNNAGLEQNLDERAAVAMRTALDTTRILSDAGVTLLAGSDQVVPGASLDRELELLVRAGLTPLAAIRTATANPVRVFGIKDRGTVEPGKRADLVVLDGDPLADISNIRKVHWTISGGRVFEPAALWNAVDIRTRSQCY